jgi:hypothetical protein
MKEEPKHSTIEKAAENYIKGADYFIEENELTKQMFDLDEILTFQLENDVQIIRGEDYQYMCYINKLVYATRLTPMFALSYGIKCFKERS